MPSLRVEARRDADQPGDVVALLRVDGPTYADGHVDLELDGAQVVQTDQPAFHAFVARTLGRPVRDWVEIGASMGCVVQVPAVLNTTASNALKALMLVYQWIEPAVVARHQPDPDELLDQIIIDNTGAPGRQPFLYILDAEQQRNEHVERLFAFKLLARVEIAIVPPPLRLYFKPLAVPTVLPARLDPDTPAGGATYQFWSAIRDRMTATVERRLRRRG